MFVLMTERKTQLDNVAFGGAWAEGILTDELFREVLAMLRATVENRHQVDPTGPQLDRALEFVTCHIEKGPLLAAAFRRGVMLADPRERGAALASCYSQIERWAGF